jgi:hypothetical protein
MGIYIIIITANTARKSLKIILPYNSGTNTAKAFANILKLSQHAHPCSLPQRNNW